MEAIAHNPGFAKKVGIPQSVGKDFSNADKGKSFSKGGDMATKMDPRMMAMMAAKARGGARPPMGGMGARPPMGGMGARPPMPPPGGGAPPMGMKRGGMANFEKSGKDVESKKHGKEGSKKEEAFDKTQMGMKRGGMTKKMASGGFVRAADGIAQQGKTKATQIKMKSGGKIC
jgi:hypothetical protein